MLFAVCFARVMPRPQQVSAGYLCAAGLGFRDLGFRDLGIEGLGIEGLRCFEDSAKSLATGGQLELVC